MFDIACRRTRARLGRGFVNIDQIAVGRSEVAIHDRVNLVYTIEVERVGAFDWNRIAVPIKRNPL